MPISFLTTALLIVSVITNLTVEGIKKLLDKVIQMLKQIQSVKEETKNE